MPSNQNTAQDQFKQLAGTPARPWQVALARLSPKLFGRLTGVYEQSFADGRIPHKLRHLIWIAVNALPTHLYPVGVALHAREAMKHGASVSEIVEALEIASTVGERSLKVTLPIILEELQAAGLARPDTSRPLTREAQAVKGSIHRSRWRPAGLAGTGAQNFSGVCRHNAGNDPCTAGNRNA